jgi:hypothetical protein
VGKNAVDAAADGQLQAFAKQIGSKMSDKYNLKDYSSPYNFHLRNDQLVREYQISIENMSMVRQELSECVRTEGINHFVNCKELRQKYFELCNDKFRGMVMPPDSKPMNREVPGLIAPPAKK